MTATDHRVLTTALRGIPGVADADVDPDGEGGPGTLRLRLAAGADQAAVAASVGRVLREQFGLGVYTDRVQIVASQVEDDPTVVPEQPPEPRCAVRPAFATLEVVSAGLKVTARVTLSWDERSAVGEAGGAASQVEVHRSVATATLRAVEQLAEGRVRFDLEHLEVTPIGSERTVVVGLTLLTGRGAERLTGAAAVRADLPRAVIDATLDALYRRFESLLGGN